MDNSLPESIGRQAPSLYQKLNSDKKEIRLVSIESNQGSTNTATLETISLNSIHSIPYFAVSYVWGLGWAPGRKHHFLIVDGQSVEIRLSLALVVDNLGKFPRTKTGPVKVWIDAICINQDNISERNQQVSYMYAIYRGAMGVLCFLEPGQTADFSSDDAMDLVTEAKQHLVSSSYSRLPQVSPEWFLSRFRDPKMSKALKGLCWLLRSHYWQRGWIIQEFLAARKPVFVTGLKMVECHLFFAVVDEFRSCCWEHMPLESPMRRCAQESVRAWAVAKAAYIDDPKTPRSLLELLRSFSWSETTDRRDKIFSLLNLARPYPNVSFTADYNLSWQETFLQITKYIIQGSGRLDVLALTASLTGATAAEMLPSWVPNYSRLEVYQGCTDISQFPGSVIEDSCNSKAGGLQTCAATFRQDGNVLITKVILLGESIHYLSDNSWNETSVDIELPKFIKFLVSTILGEAKNYPCAEVYVSLMGWVFLRFREALLVSASNETWAWSDWAFLDLCFGCFAHGVVARGFERFELLKLAVEKPRTLFVCTLPSRFTLLDDLQKTYKTKAINPLVRAWAETHPTVHAIGFSRWNVYKPGDRYGIVRGCNYALLLRPAADRNGPTTTMRVNSEAYVSGLMHGEAIDEKFEVEIHLI